MAPKIKAIPLCDSESGSEDDELVEKRIKLIRELAELEKPPERFFGGIKVSSESDMIGHSTSASLSAAEKQGLKEVEELERELDLKNTFSKETNRRDEDAEMNKYIDEQIRLRREAVKKERQKLDNQKTTTTSQEETELAELFRLPIEATDKVDDILLHSLSKNMASNDTGKSEAMLSSQMLNGIPEVDLGIDERIRTIEATEEAKLRMASSRSSGHSHKKSASIQGNYSSDFQRHRNNRINDLKSTKTDPNRSESKTVREAVVVVGEDPEEVEYRVPSSDVRPPPRNKASDDYHLNKFKKHCRK